MLADGVIERSASAWSSAPVIVKKADGSNRFCIDYRDLNKVTKKDAYPVPNIDHILDKLRRARRRNPKVDVGDLKPYKTSEEKQNRREGEPPRAAGYRTEAWAVAVVEERPSPPAQAQGPPAASWRREPRQQVYPEQYRAPQLSELEMYRRVMERQAQIEAARAEHQRAVEEAYAIELIRARAFARTGPYHQWEGPPRDQR
uniref:Uncharacterized protein n=1 Tax=Trichogramma kaykai TaxID=54128 RepID=A0ABD2XPG2_9HYME